MDCPTPCAIRASQSEPIAVVALQNDARSLMIMQYYRFLFFCCIVIDFHFSFLPRFRHWSKAHANQFFFETPSRSSHRDPIIVVS
jgi:hypothetical protein